ncbi:hypothetical protein CHUAL_004070 [Chamberlinius hualienensis]
MGESTNKGDSVTHLSHILEKWELENGSGADPLPTLNSIAELMEKETEVYLKMDPDPFDDRHPGRSDPNCTFGHLLKNLFKNESFMNKLVNNYLMHRENRELNTAAARLALDIMPGLEISVVFQETDGLVPRLYQWAEFAAEPLRSYATGLLAAAMEVQDIAGNFREQNSHLIPIMLRRLHEQRKEETSFNENHESQIKTPRNSSNVVTDRPFAHLNGKGNGDSVDRLSNISHYDRSPFKAMSPPSYTTPVIGHSGGSAFAPSMESCSNGSWAEMEPFIIGTHKMFPLTPTMQQRLTLQYLTAMGEYQEMLSYVFEHNSLDLILHFISLNENKDVRLAFEALKYLAALLCHKKFAIEFVSVGGVRHLLQVVRPSIAATGVSMCLYYLAYNEDALERVCLLPHHVLEELVNYALWLLECSHESSRCHATMFFGLSFQFRAILELFDEQDGLRKLYNMISTLQILSDEPTNLTDDEVFGSRQTARQVCNALKKYFEAHLAVKSDELRNQARNQVGSPGSSSLPRYIAAKFSPEVVQQNVETLLELLPPRAPWTPVDEFHRLSGITLLLQLIAIAYDWNYSGRSETIRCALDVIGICSIVPKMQMVLCEPVALLDSPNSVIGMNILLGAAEGQLLNDPEVQRAALNVIINCVCSPAARLGGQVGRIMSGNCKKKLTLKNGDDLATRVWSCVRFHNGIMVLLNLLTVKTPITDADSIRALACKALVGLARSEKVKQIISKLPLSTNGQLQVLMKEPVLQDNRSEHIKFCRYAMELIERVTGKPLATGIESSIAKINKADVVAHTKIVYNEKQLLQLIHQHLLNKGLMESAGVLQREASLPSGVLRLNTSNRLLTCLTPTSSTTKPPRLVTSNQPVNPCVSPVSTGSSISSTLRVLHNHDRIHIARSPIRINLNNNATTASTPTSTKTPSTLQKSQMNCGNYQQSPIMKKQNLGSALRQQNSNIISISTSATTGTCSSHGSGAGASSSAPVVTLDGIVTEYLRKQHALCKNPVVICPPFDLFAPHRCPDPKYKNSAPVNIAARLQRRLAFPQYGGNDGIKLDRRFIYSRFKSFRTYRDTDESDCFTCCKFSACDQSLIFGTHSGELQLFNVETGLKELGTECHGSQITHVEPSKDGKLVLASSAYRRPVSALWSIGDAFTLKHSFDEDTHVEFSKMCQDRIVGTRDDVAVVYDVVTGRPIATLKDRDMSNHYTQNRATFNPTDELVFSDGVLWDVRGGKAIHKFDKFNPSISGVFHPNGLEIVANSEIWDIRTFHLLHTVTALDQCQITFNHKGDVIYGVLSEEGELLDGQLKSPYGSSFRTFDATDYTNIATVDIKKNIFDLCTDTSDCYIAIIENQNPRDVYPPESICRLYEVGRSRAEDDETEKVQIQVSQKLFLP